MPIKDKPIALNVLITSLSKKIPLIRAVRNALERIDPEAHLIGGDIDGKCIGRYFVDGFWKMPPANELSAEDVVGFCRDKRICAIIPTRDGELEFFAGNKSLFDAAGISVMIASLHSVRSCIDKWSFYEALKDKPGVNLIPVKGEPDCASGKRWVVKERYGAGSKNVCIDLSADAARQAANRFETPIFQPYIDGLEYSIDVYINRARKPKGCIVRTRDVVKQGESQVTTTVEHKNIADTCLAAAGHLSLTGHMVFQAIEDFSGSIHLMECNSRFGGASTLSIAAGLDSFYWFFREGLGDDLGDVAFVESPGDLRQVRYAADKIIAVPGRQG
ncbi:MAG: carbamoyl-phosphate synthase [Proteobacteria bacterium]|nr:MAG: carbamoyl-phosphate synthase [Pseudomonadota bacterium]PIE67508.1 MAG: carbamoyl-phosphate synthase [Deltaproteobacteria bacterium]